MKPDDFQNHIEKTKQFLNDELAKIRAGRATTSLIDDILVDAYDGSVPLPINELASVSILDSQMLIISPWDKSVTKKIESAIASSGKGLNPINDGENIRIPVPVITEERRKNLAKDISALVEQAKIRLRTLRQDVIKSIEEQENNGIITEDDMYRMKKEIDQNIAAANMGLESIGDEKEKEVMKV